MDGRPHALDELIAASAAPEWVATTLERLGTDLPDARERIETDPAIAAAVVAVVGISNSLTRLVLADPRSLDVLANLDDPVPLPADADADALVQWKRLELLRIVARDQLGVDGLAETGRALARLGDAVLAQSLRLTGVGDELVVVGMGKLGGDELNYASDVDVMLCATDGADADALAGPARQLLDIAGRCFRVDADLRPEGRNGALVRTLAGFESYWDRWAEPWEFQALLKARPVAGPTLTRAQFAAAAAQRLWTRAFDAESLRSLRTMKERTERLVRERHGVELKRGEGGIRDIEFAVQLLQLVHGGSDPRLRQPSTLAALRALGDGGYVAGDDNRALCDAYVMLRTVEHRLQLVEEQQTSTLPTSVPARRRLARSLGFVDTSEQSATEQLDEKLVTVTGTVRSIHERLYFRPLLEAFAHPDDSAVLSAEAIETRLAAFGFRDADRTRQAIAELTRGLTRSSRLMRQLLPLLLGWLAESPDPDGGLLHLRRITTGGQRATAVVTAFRDSPEVARRLTLIVGTSRLLAEHLVHNPDMLTELDDDGRLGGRPRAELVAGARTALAWRHGQALEQAGLKRFTDREGLRIAAADVLGAAGVSATSAALSDLAESAVEVALEAMQPRLPFAVVGVGRLGGGELSYASDLDVLFVYEGAGAGDAAEAERVATGLMRFLMGSSPANRIYDVDADLRPEGRQGPLARSVDGYGRYFERWAAPWERLALVRARPVAGDDSTAAAFTELLDQFVWAAPLPDAEVTEIRRLKARMERERIPAGDDPRFHLKLGPGSLSDVEFTLQLQQLRHGVRARSTPAAAAALADHLDDADVAVLVDSWRFCESTRNRLFLVQSARGDSLPTTPEVLTRLARALDTTPSELREAYRRVTRRARAVAERLFYGRR